MWRVFYGSRIIGDSRVPELALLDKKLELSLNQTGTFSFTVPPFNEGAGQLELLQKTDEVSVEQDGECLFRGRVMSADTSFDGSVEYRCEGDRGYLNDAVVQPYATGEDDVPTGAFGFFTWLVNQYNDSMAGAHRFTIGINQGDQLGSVDRQSSGRSTVWAEMKAAIVDQLGGYVRTRHENGMRIIDLLASGDDVAEQRIQFGENLMDFTRKVGGADYCTRVYATGGTPEKANRDADEQQPITLNSLGSRDLRDGYKLRSGWVIDSRAEKKYGVIEASHTFEGVLDKETLMEDALRWLSNVKIGDTIEMTALDLAHIDPDAKPIYVGDYVRATSRPHSFDEYFICVSRSYDLDHPENDTFVLGSEYDTLTGAQSKKLAELNGSINTYVDYLGDVKDLADSKAEVFLTQPTKYNKGDLWVLAPQDGTASQNILVATVGSTGGFSPTNWTRASDYTNNTAAQDAQAYAESVAGALAELESEVGGNIDALEQALDDAARAFDEDAEDFAAAAASMKSLADAANAGATRAVGVINAIETQLNKSDADIAAALKTTSDYASYANTRLDGITGTVKAAVDAVDQKATDAGTAAAKANGNVTKIINGLGTSEADLQSAMATVEDNASTALANAADAQSYAEGVSSALSASKPRYATSTNLGTTQAKTATLDPSETGYAPAKGATVIVRFTNKLNVDSPTLNVGGSGAKPMVDEQGNALTKDGGAAWSAGEAVVFVYDGTSWVAQGAALKVQQYTDIQQTDEAITLSAVRSLVNSGRNISPFFEADFPTSGTSDDYWAALTTSAITRLGDGWAKVTLDNREGSSTAYANFVVKADESASNAQSLTMLVEIKGYSKTGSGNAPFVYANPGTTEARTPQFGGAGSDDITGNGEIRRRLNATGNANPNTFTRTTFGIPAGTKAVFTARVSAYEDGTDNGGNRVGYTAAWKPYSGGIVYTTKAELSVTASEIESSVKSYFEDPSTGKLRKYVSSTTVNQTDTAILQSAQQSAESYADALGNELKATYATSSTGASDQTKAAACTNFKLYNGVQVAVKFTYANTHATPKLNVNSTGAKSIKGEDGAAVGSGAWDAGETVLFVYDGTNWIMQGSVGKRTYATRTAINQTNDSIESLAEMNDTYTTPTGGTATNQIKSTVTQTAAKIDTRFHDFIATGSNMLMDTDVNTYDAVNAPYPRGHDTGVSTSFSTMSDPPVKGLTYAHRWNIEASDSQTWQNYSFYNRVNGSEQHGFRLMAGQKYTMSCWVRGGYNNQAKARLYLYSNTDDGDASGATCISYEFDVKTGWNFVRASGECPETRNYRAIFSIKPQGNALYVQMCGFSLIEGVPANEYDTLIRESQAGIEVGKVDASGDYVQAHSLVGTDGFHVIGSDGTTEYGFFTSSGARVGLASSNHIDTDGTSIGVYSGSTLLGKWNGSEMQLGKNNGMRLLIGAIDQVTGIWFLNGDGTVRGTINGNLAQFGRSDRRHLVQDGSGMFIYSPTPSGSTDGAANCQASFTSDGALLGSSSGWHTIVTSTGMNIRNGSASYSLIDSTTARIGRQAAGYYNVAVDASSGSAGIFLQQNTTPYVSLAVNPDSTSTSKLVLGKSGSPRTVITTSEIGFVDGSGNSLGTWNGTNIRLGKENNAHIVLGSYNGVAAIHLLGYTNNTEFENATITSSQITLGRLDHGHLVTNSSGLYIYDEASTVKAMFTSSGAQLGADSGKNVLVTSTGVQLRDYVGGESVVTGQFTSSGVRIGVANSDHMNLNSTGLAWYKGGFGTTTEGASNRFLYLTTGSQNVTEGSTTYTYANSALRVGCRYRAKYNSDTFVEYTDDGPNVQMAISNSEPALLMKIGDTSYTTISATKARIGRHANGYYNIVVDASTNGAGLFLNKSTGTGATAFTTLASFTDSAITMGKANGRNVVIGNSEIDFCVGSSVKASLDSENLNLGTSTKSGSVSLGNHVTLGYEDSINNFTVMSGIAHAYDFTILRTRGTMSVADVKLELISSDAFSSGAGNGKINILSNGSEGLLSDWVVDDYTSTSSGYGTTANTSTVHWRKWASGRLECERTWFGSRTVQTAYTPATGVTFYTTASAQQGFNWGDTKGNTDSYYGFVTVDSFTIDVTPADGIGLVWSEVYDWATTNSRNNISGGHAYIYSLYSIAAKNYYVTQKIVGWWK